MGDGAIRFGIIRNVGVQQVETDMASLRGPHPHLENAPGEFQVQREVLARLRQGRPDRQVVRVGARVGNLLVTVAVDDLGEVTHVI